MPITETIIRTLYKFDELTEKAQERAIERLYDLNVDHEWWDYIYEDAARIGLIISEFDTYRGIIDGVLTEDLPECVRLIKQEHGESCDTYNTATQYLADYLEAAKQWHAQRWAEEQEELEEQEDGYECEEYSCPSDSQLLSDFSYEDERDDILQDFRKALLGDYLSMLRNEYYYLTGEEAIKETIEANDYLFTEDGVLA